MIDYNTSLHHLIAEGLKEDIGTGDYSTLCCVPKQQKGQAVLKIKEEAILAGMKIAGAIFKYVEPSSTFTPLKKDGDVVKKGEQAFTIRATTHTILSCERLVLNCMQRMSGIATLTRQYTQLLTGYHTRLLDTRKTTPNFRLLEKEAVCIGGGLNHRMGLYDMIMLKDNHIDFCGGIIPAIEKAYTFIQQHNLELKIEVEVRNIEEVKQVMAIGKINRIMLDNFTPKQLKEALHIIEGKFETEASGGINLNNIQAYAATGVDFVSVGAVIHQAKSIDLSLKAIVL